MVARRTAAVLLGCAALAGCTSHDHSASRAASTTSICRSPESVKAKVHAYVQAYDRGEPGLADRFFAPAPLFRWYSENGRRQGSAAYDRSTLGGYLTGREQQGDQLELVEVTPSGSGGDFRFTVKRNGEEVLSKGAVDCRTGLFVVWSLGPDPGP